MLRTITVASVNVANMSFAENAKQKAAEINVRTSHPNSNVYRSTVTLRGGDVMQSIVDEFTTVHSVPQ